jgi:hypothetical protein
MGEGEGEGGLSSIGEKGLRLMDSMSIGSSTDSSSDDSDEEDVLLVTEGNMSSKSPVTRPISERTERKLSELVNDFSDDEVDFRTLVFSLYHSS